MPVASRLILLAVLLLASLVLACGGGGDDDDDNDGGSEPTGTRTAGSTATGTTVTPTPGTGGGTDEKTPGPDETPGPEETPVNGPTAPPPASQGTPAAEPADPIAYLSQFQGRPDLGEEGCSYNPPTRVTDCGVRGIYSVRPPLPGQDISCFITIVGGNPEFIRCSSVQPSVTKWYEIQ